ncbi:MAG: sensor histidine kinase [Cyanobacteria bacterium J06629_19]
MEDLGKALLNKLDDIIGIWVKAVRADLDIESNQGLTYEAVHNGLPDVLESVATLLTNAFTDENEELREDALKHGSVRAAQGFDLSEIVREYRILRNVLLLALEPELMTGSALDVLKAVREIDNVLDDVVLRTLESYMAHRFSVLEQMHSQLLLTNHELTRLVQTQKDNVSHLAHELKNPLNSIIGFSSLLLQKQQKQLTTDVEVPMEMQQMERILANGRQLLRLINNTLEVSRQEAEQMTLTVETVQVVELITTVVDALSPSIEDREIELTTVCEGAPPQVNTDSLRLQQILTNLVSNAIRYTEKGQITVTSYVVDDGIESGRWAIAVSDTGVGISEAARSKVFEPYFQAADDDDRAINSSGLGLTIVNKLVRLLQGEIQLESVLGEGSTFTVTLPIYLESAD